MKIGFHTALNISLLTEPQSICVQMLWAQERREHWPKGGHCSQLSKSWGDIVWGCWENSASSQKTSKVMLKILQARIQQYVNWELPDVQPGFRKGRETRDQIAICWIIEKAREFQKNIYFCFIMPKPLTVWITTNCGKFFKRWNTRPPHLPPEKSVCRSGSNS